MRIKKEREDKMSYFNTQQQEIKFETILTNLFFLNYRQFRNDNLSIFYFFIRTHAHALFSTKNLSLFLRNAHLAHAYASARVKLAKCACNCMLRDYWIKQDVFRGKLHEFLRFYRESTFRGCTFSVF